MASESLRTVRDRFSEYVDRVSRHHERVVVTKNGRNTAVLMSVEDLESLEETLEILGDADIVAQLVAANEEYKKDEVVRGVDAVRQLLN